MNIGKKLYLSFGIILATVLVLFVINIYGVHREHETKAAAQRSIDMTEATSLVRFQMMQNRLHLQNYLLSGDTRDVEKMTEGERQLSDALHHSQELANSAEQRSSLERVQGLEQAWNSDFANPLVDKRRAVDSGNATVAELQIFYLQKDPNSWVSRSSDVLDDVDRENRKLLEERRHSDDWAATFTIVMAVLSSLAALALGAVIAYRTAAGITGPLERLIHVADQIGQTGDLEHTIDVHGKDEIGQLARTFDSMVKYLKEMAAVSEAIAGGNLSVEVRPRSANDTLANAFTRMVEGLRGMVRNVRDAASQVASASTQVASASDESARNSLQTSSAIDEVTSTMHEMSVNVQNMVKSTQTQASSVSETSASIDQMVTSIQRVADTAKVLLDISNRSREEVHSGIGTMEKVADGLNRINTTTRSSGEIIDSLGTRADDIGKIVEVIDDLAEQTNLLALNAAIEAARAGEHGLGFAVVADEVRKLAEKSAQSTKEISELIESIQKEARKAVENMEKSTTIVNEGLNLGQELNAALRKISNVVTEVYKFAQEIGAATNEQSHGSSQIARATTRLNEITHEINSAVEEQASGAQAVVQAMERMRELVQSSTSGSTELAASSDQMSKMSRGLLDSMDRFALRSDYKSDDKTNDRTNERTNDSTPGYGNAGRSAAAGSR
jgi:methyl-accepting chemotaxis protein